MKKSLIYKKSSEEFCKIIENANSIADALSMFGLSNIGGNYRTLKKRIPKIFNVSDKTIKNRCIKFGINIPPIGYWLKK